MLEEKNEKRCSGCKTPKTLDNFYKNKLVLDGHSNYCIGCTRENSRKYFQRKKEKQSKSETDSLIKLALFGGQTNDVSTTDADSLMKVLMIERLLKSVTEELSTLKKNLTSSDMFISQ
jgi:hypothetical protein